MHIFRRLFPRVVLSYSSYIYILIRAQLPQDKNKRVKHFECVLARFNAFLQRLFYNPREQFYFYFFFLIFVIIYYCVECKRKSAKLDKWIEFKYYTYIIIYWGNFYIILWVYCYANKILLWFSSIVSAEKRKTNNVVDISMQYIRYMYNNNFATYQRRYLNVGLREGTFD